MVTFCNSEKAGAAAAGGTCESEPECRWSPVVAAAAAVAEMLNQISSKISKQISTLIPSSRNTYILAVKQLENTSTL